MIFYVSAFLNIHNANEAPNRCKFGQNELLLLKQLRAQWRMGTETERVYCGPAGLDGALPGPRDITAIMAINIT